MGAGGSAQGWPEARRGRAGPAPQMWGPGSPSLGGDCAGGTAAAGAEEAAARRALGGRSGGPRRTLASPRSSWSGFLSIGSCSRRVFPRSAPCTRPRHGAARKRHWAPHHQTLVLCVLRLGVVGGPPSPAGAQGVWDPSRRRAPRCLQRPGRDQPAESGLSAADPQGRSCKLGTHFHLLDTGFEGERKGSDQPPLPASCFPTAATAKPTAPPAGGAWTRPVL